MVFTDWVAASTLSNRDRVILRDGMAALGIHTELEYRNYIDGAGFNSLETEDLSSWWAKMLPERYKMYQSKNKEAGEAYRIFVEVIEAGKLGGMRFTVYSA